jgi:hypothetical protein
MTVTTIDWINLGWTIAMNLPTLISVIGAAFAGERTAHKFLKAACQTVYTLAGESMDNASKRETAVQMMYHQFPAVARMIPAFMMAKLVDIAWEQVVKPIAQAPAVGVPTEEPAPQETEQG